MDIYLLHYNNYYNRRLRVERRTPVLSDYTPYILGGSSGVIHNVNFNPRNEIDTSLVIGSAYQLWLREWGNADYLLEVDPDTSTIISRWFVVSQDRIRSGQYNLALHRDIIADNLDKIMSSPMLVEKGYVTINDPAIFNKEDMTFNQIKQNQYLLKDRSNTGWIVGYLARLDPGQTEQDKTITAYEKVDADFSFNNVSSFPYKEYVENENLGRIISSYGQQSYIRINNPNGDVSAKYTIIPKSILESSLDVRSIDWKKTYYQIDSSGDINADIMAIGDELNLIIPDEFTFCSYLNSQSTDKKYITPYYAADIYSEYNNKIVYFNDNKTYVKVSVNIGNDIKHDYIKPQVGSAWENYLDTEILKITIPGSSGQMIHTGARETLRAPTDYSLDYCTFSITLNLLDNSGNEPNIQGIIKGSHIQTIDSPYDLFFIPYAKQPNDEIFIKYKNKKYRNYSQYALSLAMALSLNYGSRLYDCQIVPYCPELDKYIQYDSSLPVGNNENKNIIDTSNAKDGVDYTFFQDTNVEDNTNATILIWSSTSKFNLTLNSPLQITQPKDPVDFKVERETTMYRLCSPNWNGQFEFSALGNRGLSKFNIDCTYKPGQPYIHVSPVFNKGGLYIGNTPSLNDARGLICNGDFSISLTQSALQNYTLQNKNYQNIFDRQVENLEFNQKQETDLTKLSFATNLIQSGAGLIGSAINGSKTGVDQGLGQVGGTILGNMFGMEMLKAQQRETLDYTKDLYNMNMGNISATPNSLTRVSSFNNNNAIFPVLEVYNATSTEKQALRDKIKYNGMTVNRIGNMPSFVPYKSGIETYFKAKLIRNEDIKGSYDYITALASELNQGVFVDNKIFNT